MCGIAGYISLSGDFTSPELAGRMIGAIQHRGPDGTSVKAFDDAVLAHARLSVIDLAGGAQPMTNEDGNLWITANCEIFNYIELRNELLKAGHRFTTKSDAEVILHLYEDAAEACVESLNGQWSFAIWDTRRKRLFLSRDRIGIRPMFYTRTRSRFLFGSEIKSLFADPDVSRELDPSGLDQVFTYWCTVPPRTAFEDIRELPPGHSLVLDGRIETVRRYWDIQFPTSAMEGSAAAPAEEDCKEELFALLTDATRLRLRAHVRVGAYLSGGLDSTLTAALMRRCGISTLESFSITFDDPTYDESRFQREAVDFLETKHQEVRCGGGRYSSCFSVCCLACRDASLAHRSRTSISAFRSSSGPRDKGCANWRRGG
ncbi:MAG TPA: asparagine synthase (glutamine-hydrolyzing) [Bryobacteraceae bacterium]|nr:asparagine synthase (glutamine-hydrolyzing) [Bryobacteraceae bacterium]